MGLMLKLELLKTKFLRKLEERRVAKKLKSDIEKEAKEEAMCEMQPLLKEKYKQEMVDKLTGVAKERRKEKLKNFLDKLNKEFKESKIGSEDSINRMLGKSSNTVNDLNVPRNDFYNRPSTNNSPLPSQERITSLMGSKQTYRDNSVGYEDRQKYRVPVKRKVNKKAKVKTRYKTRVVPVREISEGERLSNLMGGSSDIKGKLKRMI